MKTETAAAETKACPDCAETVKGAAVKCRFCGHRFTNNARPGEPGYDEGTATIVIFGYVFAVLMPLIGLAIGLMLLSRGRQRSGENISIISAVVLIVVTIAVINQA